MKTRVLLLSVTTAMILLPGLPTNAQMTGTSHPERLGDAITASTPQQNTPHYVKPSPDVPLAAASAPTATYSAPALVVRSTPAAPQYPAPDPDDMIVGSNLPVPLSDPMTPETAGLRRPASPAADPDAGIVTEVPYVPGQVPEATQLFIRLDTPLSTTETRIGTPFTAQLMRPVERKGEVLLPIGSIIRGRVSDVRSGHPLTGRAMLHLQTDFITLPDGTTRRLDAQIVDLDSLQEAHVDSEGSILGSGHTKAALAGVGFTTGTAAVAGALIGGGVGAAVGAGIGAGAGAVWFFRRDLQESLPSGTRLVLSLNEPLMLNGTPR